MNSPVRQYRELNVQTSVGSADPHQLIDMLFQGASDRIMQAEGCMEHHDVEGRANAINACIDILAGLQASLDHDKGGDIAANLESLYDYMQRRLFRANTDNDVAGLREVGDLVRTLRSAWQAIAPDAPGA